MEAADISGDTISGSSLMKSSTQNRVSGGSSAASSTDSCSHSTSKRYAGGMSADPSEHRRIRSVFDTTPTTRPSASITGAPEISLSSKTLASERMLVEGSTHTGSRVITSLAFKSAFNTAMSHLHADPATSAR